MEDAQDFCGKIEDLGRRFAAHSAEHDRDDSFVSENFTALRDAGVFSAMVPSDLGGGGVSHRTMCKALRLLAGHCPSTALSLSMHQHLVAFQTWNHLHGKPGRKLLEKVAEKQIILISTGANDWLASSGNMEKVDGGFLVNARKSFGSGSPMGNILMTSAPYHDPVEGWQVLHFPVPFAPGGASVSEDWKSMGMRGTGSHSVILENVFIADEAVGMRRPRGVFHPVFSVITTVACSLIMSVYVGVAEAAARIAREKAKGRQGDAGLPFLLGEMENELTTAQLAVDAMIELANDFDFVPSMELANKLLMRKTIAAKAVLACGEKALEAVGGAGFYRATGLERLIRDLHAAHFHPLPEKRQQLFTGRMAMGLEPVEPMEFPQPAEATAR